MIRVFRWLAILFLALSYVWALSAFGATQTEKFYRLFFLFAVGTIVALAGLLGSEAFQRKKTVSIILAIGLFLLVNILLRNTAQAEGYTLLWLGWSAFFLCWLLASESPANARRLVYFIIILGLFEAAYGWIQSVGGIDMIGEYRRRLGAVASGTFINRNHFAGFMNMTFPMALACLYATFHISRGQHRSETYAKAWLIIAACAFMGLSILLSQSRFGAAGFFLTVVLAGVLIRWGQERRRSRNRKLPVISVVLLVFLTVGLGLGVGIQGLLSRFGDAQTGVVGRSTTYLDTLKMIGNHPFLGVGPNMYKWRFREYQSSEAQVWYDYAHNDYLQMAVEWGLPLALLFWGFVIHQFLAAAKRFLEDRENLWKQGVALGCASSIFSILLHSFVDFNLYIPVNWMLFCGILGLAFAEGGRTKPLSGQEFGFD